MNENKLKNVTANKVEVMGAIGKGGKSVRLQNRANVVFKTDEDTGKLVLKEASEEGEVQYDDKGKLKLFEYCKRLTRLEPFLSARLCDETNTYYVYEPEEGHYERVTETELKRSILKQGEKDGLRLMAAVLNSLWQQLLILKGCRVKHIQEDQGFICFKDGLYDLESKMLVPHTPDVFLTCSVGYPYEPNKPIDAKVFDEYMKDFTGGDQEKEGFLYSWLLLLIRTYGLTQTFLYVEGPGGTGKSIFESLARALVGSERTIQTSLATMNNDRFEAVNFENKKLISISDSESFQGSLAKLRNLTGGDRIQGRIKMTQGGFDFGYEGLVIITANRRIASDDTSGALERRMRIFEANNVVPLEKQRCLILESRNKWSGPLVSELSSIFKKIEQQSLAEAALKVKMYKGGGEVFQNHMRTWVEENLEGGKGAYVGYRLKSLGRSGMAEASRRGLLYPFYEDWCEKRGLPPESHNSFSGLVIRNADPNWEVSKVRRKEGYFIKGAQLKQGVLNRNYM